MKIAHAKAAALAVAALPALASAKPIAKPPRRPPPVKEVPVGPLPMLPSIPRVRVEVLDNKVIVAQEVNLPRGEWTTQALDFHVAFGAPGAPRAVEARLVSVGDGALESDDADPGEVLTFDRAPRRPVSAHSLLGREAMAGIVIHVKRDSLERAFKPGNMAAIRVRSALDLPDEDAKGGRALVVRLGATRGTPLTLGRVSLVAKPGALAPTRAEAHLCGPDADRTPLAVAISPRPAPTTTAVTTIAPVLAVRHTSDDLCLRFWTSPSLNR